MRDAPDWLVHEPYTEVDLGTLRSGKEAQVDVLERTGEDGRTCLLARKRYMPRVAAHKGELEALGVQRASTFRNDSVYRAGRGTGVSRDDRAIERRSKWGRQVLQGLWTGTEFDVLSRLYDAEAPVPYPVSTGDQVLVLQYLGDLERAAPQLAGARLDGPGLVEAWDQLVEALRTMTRAGIVHADLSAYNLLWWDDRLWVIDLPQAVDLAVHADGLDLLHRDVVNVCTWFGRRGVRRDAEAVFADLVAVAF